MQKWTTLPSDIALQCPAWASDETRQLAAEVAEAFNTTKQARAEVERLKAEAGTIDLMVTTLDDLVGAGSAARRGMIESLRCELLARSRFAEFLAALERDRSAAEREALERIDQARADAKAAIVGAGIPDLTAAVTSGGRPDETLRNAWGMVLNAYPAVGRWADQHREARSMGSSLASRDQDNSRHRSEAETSLRSMLTSLATAAVA